MANAVSSGNAQASTGILERAGSAGPKRGDHFRPKGFLNIWKQNRWFDRWSDDPAECTNKTKKTKASYSVSMPSKEIRMGWNAVVLPFSSLWLPTTLPTSLNSSWCDVASSSVWISSLKTLPPSDSSYQLYPEASRRTHHRFNGSKNATVSVSLKIWLWVKTLGSPPNSWQFDVHPPIKRALNNRFWSTPNLKFIFSGIRCHRCHRHPWAPGHGAPDPSGSLTSTTLWSKSSKDTWSAAAEGRGRVERMSPCNQPCIRTAFEMKTQVFGKWNCNI